MVKRTLEKVLRETASKYSVISVTGPRQSGKTTVLQTVFPGYTYVSLENPDIRYFAQTDPKGFLAQYPRHVIFDEAQHVPELFSYLQAVVDANKEPGQFILSGSQNFLLLESVSQSLAGRAAILKLLHFSITELSEATLLPDLDSLLLKGGYPPIYDREFNPADWYSNYIETYLERDVRSIKHISNLSTFKKFLTLCATRNGQILNLSSLGSDCGITHNTARDWLSILEASYIVFLLQPHTTHTSKRVIKSPKLYFYDTGLVANLLGLYSTHELQLSPHKGSLFETLIISEIVKSHINQKKPFRGTFWRDREGHEIDLVLETSKGITLMECKSSQTIGASFFKNIGYFSKKNDSLLLNSIVFYGGSEDQNRTDIQVQSWKKAGDLAI